MVEVLPLVYFTHAELKSNENLNAEIQLVETETENSNNKIKTKSTFDSATNKKKLKLNIKDDNMSYEAIEEDDQPFMIGILDKSSNHISIYKAPYFIVKPECYLSNQDENCINLASINHSGTYSEKLNFLTAAFGSSKKRKAMQTKLKNKIDKETLELAVSAAVEETKKNSGNSSEDDIDEDNVEEENECNKADKQKLSEQFSILPAPNKDAKEPYEVYNLNELFSITNNEIDRFTSELATKFASATLESIKKWSDMNIYSKYLCEHLLIYLNSNFNHQYKLAKCKLLAYMNFLMVLYNLKPAQLRSKTPLKTAEVPSAFVDRLFNLYTVNSINAQSKLTRSMPRRLKDKLICHICVLALFIDDFETSLDTFQKDLKLSIQRIVEFYQALGCYVKSKVSTAENKKILCKIACLKLPLNESKKYESKKRSKRN
jgi:DNA-directed RNA polymerase I subunit RPA49